MPTIPLRLVITDQGLVVPWTLVDVTLHLDVTPGPAPATPNGVADLGCGIELFRTEQYQLTMLGRGELAVQQDTLATAVHHILTALHNAGLAIADGDDLSNQLCDLRDLVGLGVIPEDQRTGGPRPTP